MAKNTAIFVINVLPAIKLAQRFAKRESLTPPIDIENIIKKYAEILYEDLCFCGVDGICLNLKSFDKTTKVVVNKNQPSSRLRFTLAHELGHIIIPWHIGNIIDSTEEQGADVLRMDIEDEANAFAAELLMPSCFITSLLGKNKDLAFVHKKISETCRTSLLASAIQLKNFLPSNIIYACVRNGYVEFSGKTEPTFANQLPRKEAFDEDIYSYATGRYAVQTDNKTLHWWILPDEIHLQTSDTRNWKQILNDMISDLGIPAEKIPAMWSSINGIVASANSHIKLSNRHERDRLVSACIQRLKARSELKNFTAHKDFEVFVLKRSEDFING